MQRLLENKKIETFLSFFIKSQFVLNSAPLSLVIDEMKKRITNSMDTFGMIFNVFYSVFDLVETTPSYNFLANNIKIKVVIKGENSKFSLLFSPYATSVLIETFAITFNKIIP